MSERVVENAIIEGTRIGIDRDTFLMISLTLKYSGGGQVFLGGFLIRNLYIDDPERKDSAGYLIGKILEVVDVDSWSKLRGKAIRADHDDVCVYRIGHIVDDEWLDITKVFK